MSESSKIDRDLNDRYVLLSSMILISNDFKMIPEATKSRFIIDRMSNLHKKELFSLLKVKLEFLMKDIKSQRLLKSILISQNCQSPVEMVIFDQKMLHFIDKTGIFFKMKFRVQNWL